MESVILGNGKLTIEVSYSESVRDLFQRLLAFISPVFLGQEKCNETIDLQLILYSYTDFLTEWKTRCNSELIIRRSTAENFNIVLHCGTLDDVHQIAWHERDQTGYLWQQGSQQMAIYVSQSSFIHVIEFFRYYLLALEAAKGSLILHATGVENNVTGGVVAICGAKGAGKTSTMLNLTTSGEFRYFSGDKLLIDIYGGEFRVRGWPDYPHVGAGSLRQHPEFCNKIGLNLNQLPLSKAENRDKFLFAPELFYGVLGKSELRAATLDAVVLPDVLTDKLSITHISDQDKNILDVNRLFEDPYSFITGTWHGLALPERNQAITSTHQDVRNKLYELNWLRLSGNVQASDLSSRLRQNSQLRLALVACSGSGKSTVANLVKEAFIQRGITVSIQKLAQPLYHIQRAYFCELMQSIEDDMQHQLLMEKIADNLRMLNPLALITNLFNRLENNHAQVILTDDLRDKKTDWPALVEQGYIVIRIQCDEKIRQQRLSIRSDLNSQFKSKLDCDINAIKPHFILDNNGDLNQLRITVCELIEKLLRRNDE